MEDLRGLDQRRNTGQDEGSQRVDFSEEASHSDHRSYHQGSIKEGVKN